MKLIKKRCITLIEIMIVMFLIAIITAAVAINVTGGLDEGKAFKTKTNIEKLQNILSIIVADDSSKLDNISTNWKGLISTSPLVSDPESLRKDGWGEEYQVTQEDGIIKVSSRKYEEYVRTHQGTLFK